MPILSSFLAAPRTSLERPQQRQRWLVPTRTAGMVVDYETALKYSAVWRCVNLIATAVAGLPWHVFEQVMRGARLERRRVALDHPIDWVLHRQANPEMSAFDFRQFLVSWVLIDGNAYAEIERDRAGRLAWLWPITPDRVTLDRNADGGIIYRVTNPRSGSVELPARDVFHLKGLGFDGLVGYSVIAMAARSIGLGLAAEQFGASYFQNGITPSGVLQHPKSIGDDAYKRLKQSLKEEHSGGPHHAYSPLILEEGMTWNAISAKPEEAQFLENRRFQVSDIARWYGVPMVLLEEKDASSWGKGIEQILIAFEKFGLRPWVNRLEAEAEMKLLGPQQRGRLITRMNMNALVRGDLANRKEFYKVMSGLGVFSVNDILELEDRNPIGPEGDKRLVPLNLTTLEKIGEDPPAPPATLNDGDGEGEDGDDDRDSDDDDGDGDGDTGEDDDEPTRSRVIAAQRDVLNAALRQVAAYERKRAERPLRRYRDDRDAFVQWMDKFFRGQHGHLRATLTAPVQALITLTGAHAHAETVVDHYIDRHVQMARLAFLDAFDSEAPLQSADPGELVDQLIEDTLAWR